MSAVYKISYGVYVVTTKTDKDNGCVANTFCQVTSNPNRVTITLNKANYTTNQILKSKNFNVSILNESLDFETIKRFGFSSGKDTNKFDGFNDYDRASNGIAYLTKHTNAYLTCKVVETYDLGSHIQFLADVIEDYILNEIPSITYAYYLSNIKPKKSLDKVAYVCRVCGFVYQGDELPEDFICPICKHDASVFEKQSKSFKQESKMSTNEKETYVCPVCGYSVESDIPVEKCVICGAIMNKK